MLRRIRPFSLCSKGRRDRQRPLLRQSSGTQHTDGTGVGEDLAPVDGPALPAWVLHPAALAARGSGRGRAVRGPGVVGQGVTTTALAEALNRDAAVPLEAYRAGTWVPDPAERELAEDLARGRWDALFFRVALRDVAPAVRSGRLITILEPAAEV